MSSTSDAPPLPPGALDDRSGTVIGVVIFCLLWSTAMVGLRLWSRGRIIKQLGIDDYACIAGLLVTYGSGIAIAHMTTFGLGKHIDVMNPVNIPLYLRDFYVSIVMYCAALLAIKLTFLFQYYRVLAVQQMRVVYLVAIFIVGGWGLSQLLVGIFICTPIDKFWYGDALPGSCIPNIPQWYINAAGNIITDLAVFALPLPALWRLTMPKPQKIVLIFIFSLGFFTVIISVIRIRYLHLFEDFPWENVDSSLWSVGELTSAITCACLATMKPLIVKYFPSLGTNVFRSPEYGTGRSRSRTKDLEFSTVHGRHGKSGSRSEHKAPGHVEMASGQGSEVELPKSGLKENPFEMHVVHKQSIDDRSWLSTAT
ncbi:hypothetical protein QBC35DRAFT_451095 [Podospora australis]|uniref:Rhodopsin domain-containing protein n=1 Tax=Podospora australis TaxID=1536484 RepID=A0AAN6WY24_9PEZI|nr:hypothetical protein QBC35DRAFT_451095 [Podospora australis]